MVADKTLRKLISQANRQGARNFMRDWIDKNGSESFLQSLLVPVLEEISDEYIDSEDPPIALAYIAAKVTQDGMDLLRESPDFSLISNGEKGPVVFANIEDDFHSLGRELVVTFLRVVGWKVYDMGNDIPAAKAVDRAIEVDAKIIGISAMMHTTALNIKKVREELIKRDLEGTIKLAVGGAVFRTRKSLCAEVGGDGTADNPISSAELFDELISGMSKKEL